MAICGARTKTCRSCGHRFSKSEYDLWQCPDCGEDRHCQQRVVVEGERCRVHGGASPRGVAHPRFQTGRYSKYLPDRLAERYEEALKDPELLALRDDIALTDARLADLLEGLSEGAGSGLWQRVKGTYDDMLQAQLAGDARRTIAAFEELGKLITRGVGEGAVWAEVLDVLERRRRLKESERRRLVDAEQIITVERMMALMALVVDVIRQHVADIDVRAEIGNELRSLILDRDSGPGRAALPERTLTIGGIDLDRDI
jgi:predicted RNA-binding Zn-ribbon protein involved in translation (DUF1610 family)